jgi:hypothetical protein
MGELMPTRKHLCGECFVVELDGEAILAFSARTLKKAHDLCTKDELSTEVDVFNSRGRPLWRDEADFKVRRANPDEAAELEKARSYEIASSEYDGFVFAFLVPLDAGSSD